MKNPFKSRYLLIVSGFLVGSSPSLYFLLVSLKINIFTLMGAMFFLIGLDCLFCFNSFWSAKWANGKEVSRTRKLRLLFFGITFSSFVFAFTNVCRFFLDNTGTMTVGNTYPWITIGGIPFFSVLLSFATGGLFAVLERFLDIKENGDI